MATQFDYSALQATAKDIVSRFGGSCTITHLAGGASRGTIVLPTQVASDVSIPDVGTVQGTQVVGYIENVTGVVAVGDTIVAYGKTWRVRESTQYKGPTITIAYRVILDT